MSEAFLVQLLALMGVAVRTSGVLLVALMVTGMMRKSSAAQRHLVWVVALAGALALPVISSVLPDLRLPVGGEWASELVGGADPSVGQRLVDAPVNRASVPSTDSGIVGGSERPAPGWTGLALLAWLCGAGALLGRLLLAVRNVSRLARRSAPVADPVLLKLTAELCDGLGVRRRVRLVVGDASSVPMTWGIFRPIVLLPPDADRWSHERQHVVLAHELAHVRRLDSLTQWLGHLAVALYWFNPLAWIAARNLHDERERSCDDAVLLLGTRPSNYAGHLLQLVRLLSRGNRAAAAIAMARGSRIEGRMSAILDRSVTRGSVTRGRAAAIMAAITGVVLVVAVLRPERAGGTPPPTLAPMSATFDEPAPGTSPAGEQRSREMTGVGSARPMASDSDPGESLSRISDPWLGQGDGGGSGSARLATPDITTRTQGGPTDRGATASASAVEDEPQGSGFALDPLGDSSAATQPPQTGPRVRPGRGSASAQVSHSSTSSSESSRSSGDEGASRQSRESARFEESWSIERTAETVQVEDNRPGAAEVSTSASAHAEASASASASGEARDP